jgi:WD40 repeat protein
MRSSAFALVLLLWLAAKTLAAPPITAAAFAPDGTQVLIGSQAGIEVLSWPELKHVADIKTSLLHVHDLSFSPDGKTLLAAGGSPGEKGSVEVLSWPNAELQKSISEHPDLVYRVAWSPQGNQFATAGADGICQVFDVTGKKLARYEGHSRAVLAIVYLPYGKDIVSAGIDQTLQLWDSSTGKQLRTLDNHLATVNDLAVRPGSKPDELPVVVSVSDDRTVRLWQPTIGRLMRFARLESPVRCVAWSTYGEEIVVGCNDGSLVKIDLHSVAGTKLPTSLPGRIHVLLAAPERSWFVAGEDGRMRVLDAKVK